MQSARLWPMAQQPDLLSGSGTGVIYTERDIDHGLLSKACCVHVELRHAEERLRASVGQGKASAAGREQAGGPKGGPQPGQQQGKQTALQQAIARAGPNGSRELLPSPFLEVSLPEGWPESPPFISDREGCRHTGSACSASKVSQDMVQRVMQGRSRLC